MLRALHANDTEMPRKLLFIVNPNAGKRVSDHIIETIRKEFPQNIYFQIVIWKDKDHFDEITELLKTQGYTDAIAVGGDGKKLYLYGAGSTLEIFDSQTLESRKLIFLNKDTTTNLITIASR